ncbi:MAG: hypothetical protein Q9227_007687 [Pyrenula ochraceoflavens]
MASNKDTVSQAANPRSFTNQSASAEDILKTQTVGLVNLSDFRKRRAEILEQQEKEAQDRTYERFKSTGSGATTPASAQDSDGARTPHDDSVRRPPKKKKRIGRTILSFQEDDEEGNDASVPFSPKPHESDAPTPASQNQTPEPPVRKITPNPNLPAPAPKVATKASLQAEALARDQLRREFLSLQEAVKATEILIPFVFYDGTNIPGGKVRLKKGDPIWLFLDRCRKVGAELGVSGSSGPSGSTRQKNDSRREWARVSVDDLMMVRGDVIIPHIQHYEIYYFIANRTPNPLQGGGLLFDYMNTGPEKDTSEEPRLLKTFSDDLEGKDAEPTLTKVVDRRWYERNKHIFPASMWKGFEIGQEFESKMAHATLPNPDDAVTTVLRPTEDYKTSVLSGLDPAVIMECASRGLAFWTYQASQEVFYQEWLGKSLTEKYGSLSHKMDKIIEEANSEISSLQTKISNLQLDQSTLVNKNRELYQMYTEKNKKHQQTQQLYDTLKRKILMSQVQNAASDSVNKTVDTLASAARADNHETHGELLRAEAVPEVRPQQSPNIDTETNALGVLQNHEQTDGDGRRSADILAMPPPGRLAPHRPQSLQVPTPQHRTHLPGTRLSAVRSQIPLSTVHTSQANGVHHFGNPPGSTIRHNTSRPGGNRTSHSGSSGYGISAGIKMGRAPTTAAGYHHPRPEIDRGKRANRDSVSFLIDVPGSLSIPAHVREAYRGDQDFAPRYY